MLTEREKAVLDFERSWWLIPGPKHRAIQDNLGMSPTLYYRMLRTLAEDPSAEAYDPLTVRRLLRARTQRGVERSIVAEGDER